MSQSFQVSLMLYPWIKSGLVSGLLVVNPGCHKETTPAAKTAGEPTITVIQPSRSLGLIRLGSQEVTFEVANTGSAPLEITELERSCTCTKVDINRTSVPPGESAQIKLTISPRETEQKTASVTIHSNDTRLPRTRISLDWAARGAVTTDVQQLDFGLVRPHVAVTRTFKIERSLAEIPATCKTQVGSLPSEILRAELKQTNETPDRIEETWEVTLQVNENYKDHSGRLHITFEGNDLGGLSMPVTWMVRNLVEASPSRLFLGQGDPSQTVTKSIELSADQGTLLKLSKIENLNNLISLELNPVVVTPENITIVVKATLPAEAGSYIGKIRIEFESPEGSVLELPVVCVVKDPTATPHPQGHRMTNPSLVQ